MKTVALQYGFASGKRQGTGIRRELKRAGYKIIEDTTKADIIIAHSAGCFWLPETPGRQQLMLIDPPYWPGKSLSERGRNFLSRHFNFKKNNYGFWYWLKRTLWGFFYTFYDFKRTRLIIQTALDYDLPKIVTNHRAIIVRNNDDDWLTPNLDELDAAHPTLIIKHLPGHHEDCWVHPKPYVDILALFD